MQDLTCPNCGSNLIETEKRLNGYHICKQCYHKWPNGPVTSEPPVAMPVDTEADWIEKYNKLQERFDKLLEAAYHNCYTLSPTAIRENDAIIIAMWNERKKELE